MVTHQDIIKMSQMSACVLNVRRGEKCELPRFQWLWSHITTSRWQSIDLHLPSAKFNLVTRTSYLAFRLKREKSQPKSHGRGPGNGVPPNSFFFFSAWLFFLPNNYLRFIFWKKWLEKNTRIVEKRQCCRHSKTGIFFRNFAVLKYKAKWAKSMTSHQPS